MKKIFYSILLITGVGFGLGSCSNGAYNANPSSPANNSVNPLSPLTSAQFTWSGQSPVSASINGTPWVADTAFFALDSTGASNVIAYKGSTAMVFHLSGIYKVESISGPVLDSMGYNWQKQYAGYLDSTFTGGIYCFSYLGNSGEINITENDSAFIKAEFYFQGVSAKGTVINVSNGWINVAKLQ